MTTDVTITYLDMPSKSDFKAKNSGQPLEAKQVQIPMPELNQFFYRSVGNNHYWYDRLNWSYDQWKTWVNRPDLQTWIIYKLDTPIGYFELEYLGDTANIIFFGLLPQFIGQGLGAHALTLVIEQAWELNPQRITLNTCTLDHPHAIANYKARGFKIYQQKTETRTLPDSKAELWPGAGHISN